METTHLTERHSVKLDCLGQDNSPVELATINFDCPDDESFKLSRTEQLTLLREFLEDCNQRIGAQSVKDQGVDTLIIDRDLNKDQRKWRRTTRQSLFYDPSWTKNEPASGDESGKKQPLRKLTGRFGNVVGTLSGQFRHELQRDTASGPVVLALDVSLALRIRTRVDAFHNYFLSTLLLSRKDLRLENSTVPSDENQMFDYLLIIAFRNKLREANLKGVFRTYRSFSKNDSRPRGSINLPRHLRENAGQDNGCIASRYRENSVDNDFNRLIVFCYQLLKRKYPVFMASNFDNEWTLRKLMERLAEQCHAARADSRSMFAVAQRSISHPYFTEYEALRKICAEILRESGSSMLMLSDGVRVNGMLFYMPDLWEMYLQQWFEQKLRSDSNGLFDVKSQVEVSIYGKGTAEPDHVLFALETNPETGRRDVWTPFSILDAKFKPGWYEIFSGDNMTGSFNSDFTKCLRDMDVLGAFSTGVIYPVLEASLRETAPLDPETGYFRRTPKDDQINQPISGRNLHQRFFSFPVVVPADEETTTYDDWRERFEKNCRAAFTAILSEAKKEWDRYRAIRERLAALQTN